MASVEVSVFTVGGINARHRWSEPSSRAPEPSTEELVAALDDTYRKVRRMLLAADNDKEPQEG